MAGDKRRIAIINARAFDRARIDMLRELTGQDAAPDTERAEPGEPPSSHGPNAWNAIVAAMAFHR